MIKKIATCFLVMVIAVGCAQAPVKPEKPVNPPVIEQPQKPVEQEKPKEETKLVKKIDESKDWVYYADGSEKDDLSLYDFFNNANDFESFESKKIVINIDSEDANGINNPVHEQAQAGKNSYIQGYFGPYIWIVSKEYLSVFNKTFQGGPGYGQYFNELMVFDLKTGSLLNNDELLKQFDLDVDSFSSVLEAQLEASGISVCNDQSSKCYIADHHPGVIGGNQSTSVDEESLIFINDNDKLSIILNLNDLEEVEID